MNQILKRGLIWIVLLGALFGILNSELNLKVLEAETPTPDEEIMVPKAQAVLPILLGQEGLLADLIWIRSLGYFADRVLEGKKLTQLEDLLDFATDLDPRFERIYIWAGAAFMYYGYVSKAKIMASTRFLEKGWKFISEDPVGWKHDPEYWRIPEMIGFNYAIELKDRAKGAPYIAIVARIPGSPALYKTWAATLYKNSGNWEKGTQVLEDMLAVETLQEQLDTVDEGDVKEQIKLRLEMYYKRLYGEHGEERLKMFRDKLKLLVSEWHATMPWMPFRFFALNRITESEQNDIEENHKLFKSYFPMLALKQ